ncbi:MAG: hypothetical protein E7774_11855 [Bradyrhizobium sp.]|nr:MAG: hypothetical protein E7774_11855 [Bradyrhizobium sp.]
MIDETDLAAAVAAGIIADDTRAKLIAFARDRGAAGRLAAEPASAPSRFDAVHVLYYAGALIVMAAMGLFSTTAFNALGGWALAAIALLYAAGFVALGRALWRRPETRTPGGLSIAIAVSMAPLAVYGVQDALNLWALGDNPGIYRDFFPLMNASWVYMELATVAATALALRFFPFPFILFVGCVALWFLSMDLALLILRQNPTDWDASWEFRRDFSIAFGLAIMVAAWATDIKWARFGDFGFWLHLFGALTFWGALSAGEGDEFGQAAYGAINVALIAFAIFVDRRIYAVLGAFGIAGYLGHLAFNVFSDALAFTFALSAIGLAIIFAGIWLQRRMKAISAFLDAAMPPALRALRPARLR